MGVYSKIAAGYQKMDASQFFKQWRDYADKYTQWYAPVKKYQDDYMKEGDLNWGDYKEITKAVLVFLEERKAKHDLPEEIYDFINQHIHLYMVATPEEREEIRAVPEQNRDFSQIVWGYIGWAKRNFAETGEEEWLTRAVVMISIENMAVDWRDTLVNLASLYVEAERHDLKPQSVLNAVAKISSDVIPRGGNTPMSETLRKFPSYAVLKEARRNSGLSP
jgi:hypothetical protein